MTIRYCPACASPLPSNDDGIGCQCEQCGVLLNIGARELDYTSGNGQSPPDAQKSRWRLINAHRRLAIIRPHLEGHDAYVDIGCGSGESLLAARSHFSTLMGFEINEPLVRFGREKLHVPIEQTLFSAESLPPPLSNQKKVFASSHVLEHVENPVGFVSEIRRACNPGDVLYLEVPLHTGASFRELGYRWSAWNSEHLALYSLPALATVGQRAGFAVRQAGTRVFARASHSGKTRMRLFRQNPSAFLRTLANKPASLSIADMMIADYGFVVLRA